jgi:hypothetical protein
MQNGFVAWLQMLSNLILKFAAKESFISITRTLGKGTLNSATLMNHITGKVNDRLTFSSCFRNSFSFVSKAVAANKHNRNYFPLTLNSFKWWLMSHSNAKPRSYFSWISSATKLYLPHSKTFLFLASKLRNVSTLPRLSHRTSVRCKMSPNSASIYEGRVTEL